MTKGIDAFVSETRTDVRRIDSIFVPVSGQSNKSLTFSNNVILVNTNVRVYTRPLNNGLISGHPNGDKHGSGFGMSGDFRGSWSLVQDSEESEVFSLDGRNIVRDALAGLNVVGAYIGGVRVGTGESPAVPSDTSLETETGDSFAWPEPGANSNESVANGIFLFNEYGEQPLTEFAAYNAGGNMYNRITTQSVNPNKEKEIRVEIEFAIDSDSAGTTAFTNVGEQQVAKSFRAINSTIGLDSIVFGSGSSTASKSDTALDTREFEKQSSRNISSQAITGRSLVFESEPTGQPVTIQEIGVEDTENNLLWRGVIQSFEKSNNLQFDAQVAFKIR